MFAVAVSALAATAVLAHEIPGEVSVHAFAKPEARTLRLLVRAPLRAMRDIDYPRRGPGYLDLARAEQALYHAAELWLAEQLELYAEDAPLGPPRIAAVRASLPSDPSFASYEQALAHVTGPPLDRDTELEWSQGVLDVLFEYDIGSATARFAIRPRLERLGTSVVLALRFLPAQGGVRAFELRGDPGLVRLDPRWHQAALHFVELGFLHILDGADHLLFLLCLVVPFRRLGALVLIVTAFTAAHSLTLIASAFGVAPDTLWFPPLVETLIAASILYMALENIVAPELRRRWLLTFGFGLVHGFGFSFALRETLQFAGAHLLTSLLAFNLGVELGQLLVLLVLVPALAALFRHVVKERLGTILLSALVAHTAWHWMLDRWSALRAFRFERPALDAALLASGLRWLILAAAAAFVLWLVFGVLLQNARRSEERAG
jgi:hypothetical protein